MSPLDIGCSWVQRHWLCTRTGQRCILTTQTFRVKEKNASVLLKTNRYLHPPRCHGHHNCKRPVPGLQLADMAPLWWDRLHNRAHTARNFDQLCDLYNSEDHNGILTLRGVIECRILLLLGILQCRDRRSRHNRNSCRGCKAPSTTLDLIG